MQKESEQVESEVLESEDNMLLPEYIQRMRESLSEGDAETAEALKEAQGKELVTFQEAEHVMSQDTIALVEYVSQVEQLTMVTLNALLSITLANPSIEVPTETKQVLIELTTLLEEDESNE